MGVALPEALNSGRSARCQGLGLEGLQGPACAPIVETLDGALLHLLGCLTVAVRAPTRGGLPARAGRGLSLLQEVSPLPALKTVHSVDQSLLY